MLRLMGQVLLAAIFIKGGGEAFLHPEGKDQIVASAGLPDPRVAVELNGAVMAAGGTMLALNIAPRLAATALIGSLVPTTIVGHAFWKREDEATREMQFVQFLKNLGLLGGLLLVLRRK